MTREEIIRNLKYTMEKHKNDTVATFGTNISVMCKDILDYLEQEPCEDAISREGTLKLVDDLNDGSFEWACVRTKIAKLPSIQSKTRIGRWMYKEHKQLCSECDGESIIGEVNFC